MRAKEVIENENIPFKDKKKYLFTQPENYQAYIDYYGGKQDVLSRNHPTDRKKTPQINKIVVNYVRDIVNFHAGFLFSNFVELENKSDEKYILTFEKFLKNWNDSKLGYQYMSSANDLFNYSQTAEYIYAKKGQKVRHKYFAQPENRISAYFDGDIFDCFMREYSGKELIDNKSVAVTYFEFYYLSGEEDDETTKLVTYKQIESRTWEKIDNEETYDKMPIIWYSINEPIWWAIKPILDRINENVSVTADVIDFVSYPILMLFGQLMQNADGETIIDGLYKGKNLPKLFHFDTDETGKSDGKYLESSNKNETYNKEYLIHKEISENITATPDTSFTSLRSIGNLSGVALSLMFMKTLTKWREYQNIYFNLSRAINLNKSTLAIVTADDSFNKLEIEVIFKNTIPENDLENQEIINKEIESLIMAVNSGIMSRQTAIEQNPYITDSLEEMELINKENSGGETVIV